ncbi:MAG: hypothetical protein ACAI38_21950 [Myxococcota bacterium]
MDIQFRRAIGALPVVAASSSSSARERALPAPPPSPLPASSRFAQLDRAKAPALVSAGRDAALGAHPLVGNWVMHIYLTDEQGKPVLFDDLLRVEQGPNGLTGELEVPDRFKAKLRTVETSGDKFYIDIEAVERGNKIEVKYEGVFHPTKDTFIGFAHVLPGNELLGGFVGQRLASATR